MANSVRRILVVEDEWLIADQLAALLKELGYNVIGPASNVDKATALLSASTPDAAILDVTLGKQKSFPVATALAERGIPYLFLTGYGGNDLPEAFRTQTLLPKPVSEAALKQALDSFWVSP